MPQSLAVVQGLTASSGEAGRRPIPSSSRLTRLLVVALLAAGLAACGTGPDREAQASPLPVFTGPEFFHGSVGSMAKLVGYQPQLVTGYGLVVDLPGTGSAEIPSELRQRFINNMKRMGVGGAQMGPNPISPEQMLLSKRTAVVLVEALIPPGAVKGSQFDVMVSALPQTQTTSLEGGRLWTSELAIEGANPSVAFSFPLAEARGEVYVNPFDPGTMDRDRRRELQRRGIVLAGGVATRPRLIQLALNQPSFLRSRLISDRINERFGRGRADRRDTAEAVNDRLIRINIPARYAERPERLLQQIAHLYIQRGEDFERIQAYRLGQILEQDTGWTDRVSFSWAAMGATALPVIREYYHHDNPRVRLAALRAGAWLDDASTRMPLLELTRHDEPGIRAAAGELVVELPGTIEASEALARLIDDPEPAVPIRIYHALVDAQHPMVKRRIITGDDRNKFVLDMLPARKPMVLISQADYPRIVVFDFNAGFQSPMLARLWDDRLMVRHDGSTAEPASVFYQPPDAYEAITRNIAPTIANLVVALGQGPTADQRADGANLSYSRVSGAIYAMANRGHLDADIQVEINPLLERLEMMKRAREREIRAELERRPAPLPEGPQGRPTALPEAAPGDASSPEPETEPRDQASETPDAPRPGPDPTGRPETDPASPASPPEASPTPLGAAPAGRPEFEAPRHTPGAGS